MKQTKQRFKKLVALLLAVILLFTSCTTTTGSSSQEESSLEISEVISQSEMENNNPQNTERIPNIVADDENDPYVRLLRDPNEWTPEDFIFLLNIPRIEHDTIWEDPDCERENTSMMGEPCGVFYRTYGWYGSFAPIYFAYPRYESVDFDDNDKPLMIRFRWNELSFCNYEGSRPTARDLFRDFGAGEIKYTLLNTGDYRMGASPANYAFWLFYVRHGLIYIFELRVLDPITPWLSYEEIMDLELVRVFILLEDNPLIGRTGNINNSICIGWDPIYQK